MKFLRIFLLVLIIVGIGLLLRQKSWVPKLTDYILQHEGEAPVQTTSIDNLKFTTPADFGLAVKQEQILVKSYIPPCGEKFDYCLYYNGTEFKGTNFESAGLRILRRPDLNNEKLCLGDPDGTISKDSYSASIFSNLGDAGAGHYASGEMYRIYMKDNNTCFEIETRIGETQFANYPVGTIKKFDEALRKTLYAKFQSFFDNLKIKSTGEKIVLPESED